MSAAHLISESFVSKPPDKVDFDYFDETTEKALFALAKASELLQTDSSLATHYTMSSHWLQIFPWLLSFSHGVLENPPPATALGYEYLDKFIATVSMIVLHPQVRFFFSEMVNFDASARMFESTPDVFALTFELWLWTSEIDHPAANSLLNSVGVLFNAHAGAKSTHKRFTGAVLEKLENVLRNTERWDAPGIFIKGLIHGLNKSLPHYMLLQWHVLLPNAILRSTQTLPLPLWNSKSAM
ncbi:hypothetical protein L218DRAFT_441926 [Marasmius fiardii PR-910]|nr:hypothetical protein L218DRAFT_441926 [Marasmius fiardii PR-910]